MSKQAKYGPVPRRYADLVQRYAVLYPLQGACGSDEQVVEQTHALRGRWASRIYSLADVGWHPRSNPHSTGFVCNCRPTFVMMDNNLRSCGIRDICPFCYARWVRDVWDIMDEGYERHRDEGYLVMRLARRFIRRMPDGEVDEYGVAWTPERWLRGTLRASIKLRKHLSKLKCLGAFHTTRVTPTSRGWILAIRQLFLVQHGRELPSAWQTAPHGTWRRYERLKRKHFLRVVARVCRYPRPLLTADAHRVAELLHARHRLRLSATYGCFRNS